MKLNFKNRIAFHYMVATASIMAVVFAILFFVVRATVLGNLNRDISYEANQHSGEITFLGDSIFFMNKAEWDEKEHRELQANPVFIELVDRDGRMMDKSPNLNDASLTFRKDMVGDHFDSRLNGRRIRQMQIPLQQENQVRGYILAAMSAESAYSVIETLLQVLIISYLTLLIALFFISRFLAGRSIAPVTEISDAISHITKDNLQERVELPSHQDEIFSLSQNFNALLDRIQNAIEREKQFTTDASHELRTPLATLRGTLEVLIRKPREQSEYEEKIKYSLDEIQKLTSTLEQLLLIARLESTDSKSKDAVMPLPTIIDESVSKYKHQIASKNLDINLQIDQNQKLNVPQYYSTIIVDNLLQNAIKYSHDDSSIDIHAYRSQGHVICDIQDHGIGIREEDLDMIFENFYRSDALDHKAIGGNGLGLSIVRKCAEAIGAKIQIDSKLDEGTRLELIF